MGRCLAGGTLLLNCVKRVPREAAGHSALQELGIRDPPSASVGGSCWRNHAHPRSQAPEEYIYILWQANRAGIFGVGWGSGSRLRRKVTGKQDAAAEAASLLGAEAPELPTGLLVTDWSLGLVPDETYPGTGGV